MFKKPFKKEVSKIKTGILLRLKDEMEKDFRNDCMKILENGYNSEAVNTNYHIVFDELETREDINEMRSHHKHFKKVISEVKAWRKKKAKEKRKKLTNIYIEQDSPKNQYMFLSNLLGLKWALKFRGNIITKIYLYKNGIGLGIKPKILNERSSYSCPDNEKITGVSLELETMLSEFRLKDFTFCKPYSFDDLDYELKDIYCNGDLNK
jgi:hypothetical protein